MINKFKNKSRIISDKQIEIDHIEKELKNIKSYGCYILIEDYARAFCIGYDDVKDFAINFLTHKKIKLEKEIEKLLS